MNGYAVLLLRHRLPSGGCGMGEPQQFSMACSVGKLPRETGDNQTIEICRCRNNLIGLSIIDILLASPMGFG